MLPVSREQFSNYTQENKAAEKTKPVNWREFWNHDHSIYVSQYHKTQHYDSIAKDIGAHSPSRSARLLDFGCGEALGSHILSCHCESLILFDTSAKVRAELKQRFATNPRIEIADEADFANLPQSNFDMIVCNSVLQYMGRDEFEHLLRLWRDKLKPEGQLLIADVIPPHVHASTDAKALLAFAWRHGFFFPALFGLAKTFLSPYRKLRSKLGLTTYTAPEMEQILRKAGFAVERVKHNIGHNQARMTFVATHIEV
jgi:SAM-dependent methyltransferase